MRTGDTRCSAAVLILSLSLTISAAEAQGPPGGMMPGPGGPSLVMSEAVQEDLGLTEKQKTQLKKLETSMQQKTRATFEQARDGGLEPEEMRESMGTIGREYNSGVSKVLDKNQKARLAQIEMRREGLLAVAKADVAAKIKVTPAQAKKVKTIVGEMRQALFRSMPRPPGDGPGDEKAPAAPAPKGKRAASKTKRAAPVGDAAATEDEMVAGVEGTGPPGGFFGGPPVGMPDFNSEEFREQMAKMVENEKKLREAAIVKIGEVLTKDQTEAFEKLLGKSFDFSKLTAGPPKDEGVPKADEDTPKKEAPAKSQPKMKSRKTGDQ